MNDLILNCYSAIPIDLLLLSRHPARAGLKEESEQKLPAVIAFGHGLSARLHNINGSRGSRCCDFSRALIQPPLFLHQSRPNRFILYRHYFCRMVGEFLLFINSVASHLGNNSGLRRQISIRHKKPGIRSGWPGVNLAISLK